MNSPLKKVQDYPFVKNDFLFYFKTLFRDRGFKAFYQFMNRPLRRSHSRALIKQFSPEGIGIEVGVGARTIVPSGRTVLSDAYSEHGVDGSIAKVFFRGDEIPYPPGTFQFLLSEHVLEHITNPIKTLKEWIRVIQPGGHLFLFLPHKERTNDQFRKTTPLEHLIEDFSKDIPYNDPSHFDEWKRNVIEKGLMPPHYSHMEKKELLDSASIHHHAWTDQEICKLLKHLELRIVHSEPQVFDRRDSFVVIAQKI